MKYSLYVIIYFKHYHYDNDYHHNDYLIINLMLLLIFNIYLIYIKY